MLVAVSRAVFVEEKPRIKHLALLDCVAAVPRRKHRPLVRSKRCGAAIIVKLGCCRGQRERCGRRRRKGDVVEVRSQPNYRGSEQGCILGADPVPNKQPRANEPCLDDRGDRLGGSVHNRPASNRRRVALVVGAVAVAAAALRLGVLAALSIALRGGTLRCHPFAILSVRAFILAHDHRLGEDIAVANVGDSSDQQANQHHDQEDNVVRLHLEFDLWVDAWLSGVEVIREDCRRV